MLTGELKTLLASILQQNLTADAWAWLSMQGDISNVAAFNAAFAMMPRKTGKALIWLTTEQKEVLGRLRPGSSVDGWRADRLARVWLLQQPDTTDQDKYHRTLENLFSAAEMNELVSLYSALPFLHYPEVWVERCAEGIRSNIGTVLEAIMYHNPYPAENLSEAAWNQLILKAFFTEKNLTLITGVDQRANAELSRILLDYGKERWAAGRTVDPMLWVIAEKFIDSQIINELKQGHWEKLEA